MTENQIFRIGAITLGLTDEIPRESVLPKRFPDFISSGQIQARYTVHINDQIIEPSFSPLFDSGQSWRLYKEEESWLLWVRSPNHNPYLAGRFAPDYHSGDIFTISLDDECKNIVFPLSYPMGELLMTNLLATGYGIMLHSCGVLDQQRGMIFAGISTAGKTTTAGLWKNYEGVRVLNDDRIIVRKIDNLYRVFGTPWHGREGTALADDGPLKQIFILRHAPENKATRLLPAKAAAELLVRTFAPLWSKEGTAFTLQFLDDLCQSVPVYELGFVPDRSVVDYVRCLPLD